ncbi:Phosphate transport system permease protein PstC (TC 3.A.1.7.1) [hydrothermal vent metagenome]|uniref:Phosphate transport system permease protein PstC (TC 3.A.1.7.1) n=1 Tax=hydrothermal vent metagenome TaxID=652676 RepID=A0A3B1ATP5_9ZZZZ
MANIDSSAQNTLITDSAMRSRIIKDKIAQYIVTLGGNSVIFTIVLIFFYLLYVVIPIFSGASLEKRGQYTIAKTSTQADTLYLAIEEQNEVAVRMLADGKILFFNTADGRILLTQHLQLAKNTSITSFTQASDNQATVAFGLSNGAVIVVKHKYNISYPNNRRIITPVLEYPLGTEPVIIQGLTTPVKKLAIQINEDGASIATLSQSGELRFSSFEKEDSLMADESSYEQQTQKLASLKKVVSYLLIDQDRQEFYVVTSDDELSYYDITDAQTPTLIHKINIASTHAKLTDIKFLSGGISLLTGYSDGSIAQWFIVKTKDNKQNLTRIRDFKLHNNAITKIAAEHNRKGFIAADSKGNIGIFHSTAQRTVIKKQLTKNAIKNVVFSPRANGIIVEDKNKNISFWHVENEHPEISWNSIWGKVWYESYNEPKYIWQSSAATNDFEPKFSLIPISFGTIKAAFYAMMMAIPLSIMGAIFTAYFMSPKMRRYVKPSIEIMEALPTVILGFLAGLWLAPFIENHLPGVFSLLFLMPIGVLLAAYGWTCLPERIRHKIPDGWEAAILIPVIIIISYSVVSLSPVMESALFDGDMRSWLGDNWDIDFDQRNSIIVGLAMGFAVIPTIFSIAEDAIFAVPKYLTHGSLALGATPWQTLIRVVLLTASPGIFSAIMIGFGRAVGETMIVLMATGNTPVMDFSIFQGMRTLSANIAVEMPEAEVASSHYRVLFLAALVLFVFTFFFNTIAEVVRQRLRKRYSSL